MPLTLYVHLPWCVRMCPYCDFNSHEPCGQLPERAYIAALVADLDASLPSLEGRRFATVFFGGGTPSLFAPESIGQLLDHLQARGCLTGDAEITLEANPGAADEAHFRGYREAGVNRLSLGVQSFDAGCLQALGRIHGPEEALRGAASAAEIFDNFNLDLMHGLPGQTVSRAADDVARALDFEPSHLSCYQLTLEPNTVFAKYPPVLPAEPVLEAIEQRMVQELQAAGYRRYEVSAYAREGRECQHNRHYWEFADYLGIGAGAHSKLSCAGRVWREVRVRKPWTYIQRVAAGQQVAERRELMPADRLAEFMMNALRLCDGFSLDLLHSRGGVESAQYAKSMETAARKGLVGLSEGHAMPTELGRRYLNRLVAEFLPP